MKYFNALRSLFSCFGTILVFSSCSGNGYITSSVNTVVGLDVSENPKTQVPHIRFGYVRSGLYYVPTGKTQTTSVGNADNAGPANETPTLVSEIFVHSKFLTDITISEKFAIGAAAVQSTAAQQNFANNAAQAVAGGGTVNAAPPIIVAPPTLPPRSEEKKLTASQIQQAVQAALTEHDLDSIRKPAAEVIKALRKSARAKKVTVDWGGLIAAGGGIPPANATEADFFDFFNTNVTTKVQTDNIQKEAENQLKNLPQ